MKGSAQPLFELFKITGKKLVIPLYQRNYDWQLQHCQQLLRDLVHLTEHPEDTHFFGSIVSVEPGYTNEIFIIDGQQRITSVSLLLIALVNLYKAKLRTSQHPEFVDFMMDTYLINRYSTETRKVRLTPIERDRVALDALVYKRPEEYVENSNITRNYHFFYNAILESGVEIDTFLRACERLIVINIELEENDDPQLIFESLNSTGLDLSEADKIRNYLLMSLSQEEQKRLYHDRWNPIEELTHYEPSAFVRDYLTMKLARRKVDRIDEVYWSFKHYAEEQAISREELLKDMHYFAKLYRAIDDATLGDATLQQKLSQWRTLDTKVAHPFFMAFLDYAQRHEISAQEQAAVYDLIEGYYARRIICSLPSSSYIATFATLHKQVVQLMQQTGAPEHVSYVEVLKYVLLQKQDNEAFPRDEMVKCDFKTRQVYKIQKRARTFLLERMENRDSKETHPVVRLMAENQISVEHIMPQKLSPKWKAELGEDWERIYTQYLHTMANLTLTAYNSTYSNSTFAEKRDMDHGFKDSIFRLNQSLAQLSQWTEQELLARQQQLLEVFFKLWPMPDTHFRPDVVEVRNVSLADDKHSLSGQKIQAFYWQGTRYKVNSWVEMIKQMCQLLLLEHKATLLQLCYSEDKSYFSTEGDDYTSEFSEGMHVQTHNDTTAKFRILQYAFSACNIPFSELTFELRPTTPARTSLPE